MASAVCRLDGCPRSTSGRSDLCKSHRDYVRRHGREPLTLWSTEKRCAACGTTDWPGAGRKTCSARCRQLLSRSDGQVPRTAQCVRCGAAIDLFAVSAKSGRKKRAETKLCRHCKAAKYVRHHVAVTELVNRDGADCGICGEYVDLALRHPDLMCPTVDHILPFALGESHDISNLQLAHLTCNVRKQARVGWTPAV